MESRVLKVFYDNQCYPFKDKERAVRYPIVGSSFAGSSNVNELHFYTRDIGGINNLSWVAIVKLPNGKILYQLLTDYHYDSEINEYYVSFILSQFYTQLKGDIYISLNGCLGQVEIETDEETNISTIQGEIDSRTVVATGAVKFTINYAPQRPVGYSFDLDQYQTIIQALANKTNIISTFQIVADISAETLTNYEDGQVFYDIATKRFYKKSDGSLVDYNFIVSNQASVSIIANTTTNINGRVFVHFTSVLTTIGGASAYQIKYDGENTTEEQAREYMAYMTGSSYLPKYNYDRPANTYFLTPNGQLLKPQYDSTNGLVLFIMPQLALKNYVDENFVPYTGATKNVNLGTRKLVAEHLYKGSESANNELATKGELDSAIDTIKRNSYINVDLTTYPTLDSFLASQGEEGYIYLYPIDTSESPTFASGYYQYIWENNQWQDLGTTQIDLSNYYTKPQTDNLLNNKADNIDLDFTNKNLYAIESYLGCEIFEGFEEIDGTISNGSISGNVGDVITIGSQTYWKHIKINIDKDFYIVYFESSGNVSNVNPYVIFTNDDGVIIKTTCGGEREAYKTYRYVLGVPSGATKMYVRSIYDESSKDPVIPRVFYGTLLNNFRNFGYEKTNNLFYFTKPENIIAENCSIIFENEKIIVNGTITYGIDLPIMGATSISQLQDVANKTLAITVIRNGIATNGGNATIRRFVPPNDSAGISNSVQTFSEDVGIFVRINPGAYENFVVEFMIQEQDILSQDFLPRFTLVDYIARKQIRESESKAKNDSIIENTDNLFYFTSPNDIVGDGYTIRFIRNTIITINGTLQNDLLLPIMGKTNVTDLFDVAGKTIAFTRFLSGTTSGGNCTIRKGVNDGISNSIQTFTEDTNIFVKVNAGSYSNFTARFMVQENNKLSQYYFERKTAIDYLARNDTKKLRNDIYEEMPSYYVSHIEAKSAYINNLLNYNENVSATKKANKVEQFIFFTDYHYDNSGSTLDNTQHSASLMEYLDKHIGLTFVCHGGDIINNQNNQANTFKYIGEFKNKFRNLKEKLFCCIGNHEYDQSNYLSYAQINQFLNGYQELKMGDLSDYGDYYIINKATKTVYFFMGCDRRTTGGRMMNDEQIAWFLTALSEIPNNHDVILFAHYLINITYDTADQEIVPEPSATDGEAICNAIDAFNSRTTTTFNNITYDYSGKTGTFICAFTGHSHTDLSYITSGGTPIIMTTTDCCPKRNTSYNWSTNSWNKESVAGTIEEQAFDVVTIDKQNKKIYCTRIGYGDNRTFDYD